MLGAGRRLHVSQHRSLYLPAMQPLIKQLVMSLTVCNYSEGGLEGGLGIRNKPTSRNARVVSRSAFLVGSYFSTMAHYDLFRHHLAIKYPAYGHALWEPSPVYLYPPVEIGDVGFTREGRFHRLFNTFLPAEDPSHENYGVPEYYEQLTLRMRNHIIPGTLSPNSLCSARVSLESVSRVMAAGYSRLTI